SGTCPCPGMLPLLCAGRSTCSGSTMHGDSHLIPPVDQLQLHGLGPYESFRTRRVKNRMLPPGLPWWDYRRTWVLHPRDAPGATTAHRLTLPGGVGGTGGFSCTRFLPFHGQNSGEGNSRLQQLVRANTQSCPFSALCSDPREGYQFEGS